MKQNARLGELAIGEHFHMGTTHGVVLGRGQGGGVLIQTRHAGDKANGVSTEWSGRVRVERQRWTHATLGGEPQRQA